MLKARQKKHPRAQGTKQASNSHGRTRSVCITECPAGPWRGSALVACDPTLVPLRNPSANGPVASPTIHPTRTHAPRVFSSHLASTKEHRSTAQGISHPWTLDITIIHLLAPSSTHLTASAQFPSTSVTSRFPLPLGPADVGRTTKEAQSALRTTWRREEAPAEQRGYLCLVVGCRPLDESSF